MNGRPKPGALSERIVELMNNNDPPRTKAEQIYSYRSIELPRIIFFDSLPQNYFFYDVGFGSTSESREQVHEQKVAKKPGLDIIPHFVRDFKHCFEDIDL